MTTTFKQAVKNTPVEARTENGMKALQSTLSHNVDLFFNIGASRGKNITAEFERAFQEDSDLALRIVQWARDIRGGAGERQLFRDILVYLENQHVEVLLNSNILNNVAEIGRWDDLLVFKTDAVKEKAYGLFRDALEAGNGLAAKWLPRKGKKALEIRNFFGFSPKKYRKTLVNLTKVVETQMCAKEWDKINFSHVPSLAMSRYMKAFGRNAKDQFTSYKEALKKGDPSVKVNASAVYPYDIIKSMSNGDSDMADQQWKALPNYMTDASILPLVDVSGSMGTSCNYSDPNSPTCMDVAISLGLYTSEKNTGPFQDMFLTFTDKPKFEHVTGTLTQRYRQMHSADWGYNTNLHAAFAEILRVATTNSVPAEEMPKILLILSDMQFDTCVKHDDSAMQMIERKYKDANYTVPVVVFWNLRATGNAPVRFDKTGTALISGFSPAIMKSVLAADMDKISPEGVMRSAVCVDRYNYKD